MAQMVQRIDLSGAWQADDQGVYYVRHLPDNTVWWAGLSAPWFFHAGLAFTNVFRGTFDPGRMTLTGAWADVPRGNNTLQQGNLSLDVVKISGTQAVRAHEALPGPAVPNIPPNGDRNGDDGKPGKPQFQLRKTSGTGGFGGSVWNRGGGQWGPLPLDYRFANTRRNDHNVFSDHVTPYRDFTVAFADLEGADLGWAEPPMPRDYCTWVFSWLRIGGEDQDGDFDMVVRIHRNDLDAQPHFWDQGWVQPAAYIRNRFDARQPDGTPNNRLRPETIMYGRDNDEDHCAGQPGILMPGWMEDAGDSVLINGQPLNGGLQQDFAENVLLPDPFHPATGTQIPELILRPPMTLRISGCLALDHHECPDTTDPAKLLAHLPEIHPVYALDILQDFSRRRSSASLTGAWHADDVGTYYLRDLGGTELWWLGLSRDQGRSFANVFHGRIMDGSIAGDWADVPMGPSGTRSQGTLTLTPGLGGVTTTVITTEDRSGGFSGSRWQKLYDRPVA
ncbi:hypothetical protein [Streptomyces violaceusniger]|uniref:hypothetical protein n=1 Tax=Streptomyces violaceusniger TaxID=68280 RepID=UPI001387091C